MACNAVIFGAIQEPLEYQTAKYFVEKMNAATPQEEKDEKLVHAAMCGYNDLIKDLLEKGACVNYQDGYFESPLSTAVRYGNIDTIDLLLENGGDINNDGGIVPLINNTRYRPVNIDTMKKLLVNGASVNKTWSKGGQYSVLHEVVQFRNYFGAAKADEAITLLLEYGADYNQADWLGETPLSVAQKECPEVVALFDGPR